MTNAAQLMTPSGLHPLTNLPLPSGTSSRHLKAFCVSKDNTLALAFSDGTLESLSLPFGAPLLLGKLQGQFERIRWAPCLKPRRLACSLADGVIVVWTEAAVLGSQYTPQLFRGDGGKGYEVKDISWAPDASRFASVSLDSRLRIWDPNNALQPLISTKVRFPFFSLLLLLLLLLERFAIFLYSIAPTTHTEWY